MKTLVVFYSRSGNTRKVGKEIAETLKADVDEIVDKKDRCGIFGWIVASWDAARKKLSEIKYKNKPEKYRLVIIGTPVWAHTMTPAIRTYITENKSKFKKVAFFCTYGRNWEKIFLEMEKICKKPVAILGSSEKEIKTNMTQEKIIDFCKKIH